MPKISFLLPLILLSTFVFASCSFGGTSSSNLEPQTADIATEHTNTSNDIVPVSDSSADAPVPVNTPSTPVEVTSSTNPEKDTPVQSSSTTNTTSSSVQTAPTDSSENTVWASSSSTVDMIAPPDAGIVSDDVPPSQ